MPLPKTTSLLISHNFHIPVKEVEKKYSYGQANNGFNSELFFERSHHIKLIIIFVLLASFFLAFLYWIIYEIPFPTGTVLSLAGLGLFCKIVAAILILVGGSNMIKIKSSTLLIITGFVTSLIIMIVLPIGRAMTFAYIVDAIIGIVIAIIVIIWAVYVLIGSIRGLISSTIT